MNAITDYANHRPDDFVIGFYGGEPLLEFELLKRIVLFCETLDDSVVATPRFNVTTNGTLLTDEVIHFLVGHRFNVTISLDGPKHVHDRYRVFRNENSAEERRGSFERSRSEHATFCPTLSGLSGACYYSYIDGDVPF